MIKWLIKHVIVPLPDIFEADRVMVVAPHPDDAEIACGGLIKKLADAGKKVVITVVCDDRYSITDLNSEQENITDLRREEQLRSAELLGAAKVRFLSFADGGLYETEELMKALALAYAEEKPDIVLAPDPNLSTESHMDHLKTGRAALSANFLSFNPRAVRDLGGSGCSDIKGFGLYFTAHPNRTIALSRSELDAKIGAVKCHASQLSGDDDDILRYIRLTALRMGLRRFCLRAEGYKFLSANFIHCMTEWGD